MLERNTVSKDTGAHGNPKFRAENLGGGGGVAIQVVLLSNWLIPTIPSRSTGYGYMLQNVEILFSHVLKNGVIESQISSRGPMNSILVSATKLHRGV